MMTILFVQIACLALMTYQTSVQGLWTKYSSYNGWKLNQGSSTVLTRHRHDCVLVAMETESEVVSYQPDDMEFRMAFEVSTLIEGVTGDVLYLASNSSRVLFVKNNSHPYSSSSEADQACVEFGARLMDGPEVQALLSTTTHFYTCSCGWVLNEYPMSIDGPLCRTGPRTVRSCNNALAHAWCLLEA